MTLRPTAAVLLLALPSVATASSSSSGEEFLSTAEAAPPNILFLVDMSSSMNDPCPGGGDSGTSAFSNPCIEDVANAIDMVTQHFDFARYGVIGTSDESTVTDGYYPIVPLGSSHSEISAAMATLTAHSTTTKNLGEALADAAANYLSNTTTDDPTVDADGDGYDYDWTAAPIDYYCQKTHIIVLTNQRPEEDDTISSVYQSSLGTDVTCTTAGRTVTTDTQCLYDNVVKDLYSDDLRSDLSGTQNVVVHTVGLGIDGTSVAEELYGNASNATSGDGVYAVAGDPDQILSWILWTMKDIRSGSYSRSTPVVSADGNFLVYSFYEMVGDSDIGEANGLALGQGHVRAYAIDDDPTSATYGQVVYDNTNCGGDLSYSCGGALWDGGDLLVSRLVTASDRQWDENDGVGYRDIYTFFEDAVGITYNSFGSDAQSDKYMPFDRRFVEAVGSDTTVLDKIVDLSTDTTTGCSTSDAKVYDLDKGGGCAAVDEDDLKALVAFTRGYNSSEFRYLSETRGRWRLGDSPHSVPVIVQGRNNVYSPDPTYRTFLAELQKGEEDGEIPAIVLTAANDGMLHAFALQNNPSTGDTEEGEELWAWIPGYLLYRKHDAEWAGRLVDMMLYGRTFLFDGSPVVEDVWIDENGDGAKQCTSVPSDCEWRRVVVVQQGKGGPVTLALDITDTDSPKFLWEQTDETDTNAMAYTTGRPVIGNIYDTSDSSNPKDSWVAFWGSGRGVPYSTSTSYYENHEANLYMWSLGDDYWGTLSNNYQAPSTSADYARGDNYHPEAATLGSSLDNDTDAANHYEYAYISASLSAVDTNSDGDVDTLYFPMTTSYSPTSEGGSGPGDLADPGSSWMYKACVDSDNPGEFTWIEFFDPVDDGGLSNSAGNGYRPEVYYSATTSWLSDGSLGVYWGTGTPYDRTGSESGYFFAMKDTNPASCASDTMTPITDCGSSGIITLNGGEGLTGEPVVYAGVVFFSTWIPESDRCDGGTGRVYGIDFEDCTSGIDTNGDGTADATDDSYVEHADEYISGITVSDKGTLFYGTSGSDTDGGDSPVGQITAATDPFLGTNTLAWMEVF
jgi:hypothetical protein